MWLGFADIIGKFEWLQVFILFLDICLKYDLVSNLSVPNFSKTAIA